MRAELAACGLLLAGVAAVAGCGGGGGSEKKDPFSAISGKQPPKRHTVAPRWEHLATITGTRAATREVAIDRRAIQWRARWRCSAGRFEITVAPPPSDGKP